jgi:hypothetical protein
MKEAQTNVRDYLAAIGKRGGLASRRELTRSHAKQMVTIREAKRRGGESGKAVASARPQTIKAQVTDSDSIVSGLRYMAFAKRCSGGCVSREGVPRGDRRVVNVIYHKPLMMNHWRLP